jgi:hypothetical protein
LHPQNASDTSLTAHVIESPLVMAIKNLSGVLWLHYVFATAVCFSVDTNKFSRVAHWPTRRSPQFHESVAMPRASGDRDRNYERDISAEEDFINLRNQICAYNNSELFERYVGLRRSALVSQSHLLTHFAEPLPNSYCRFRYSNIIPMTVNILREEYGARETWWGDLSAAQTRTLYQRLLPRVVLIADEFKEMPLKDRAYIASMARYAAKLYARERSMVPERAAANLYDGARYFSRTGKLSWTGPTVDEIWLKYENDLRREYGYACDEDTRDRERKSPFWEGKMNWEWVRPPGMTYWPPNGFWGSSERDAALPRESLADECVMDASGRTAKPGIPEEELYRRLYERVLKKSCTTDPFIDRIALGKPIRALNSIPPPAALPMQAGAGDLDEGAKGGPFGEEERSVFGDDDNKDSGDSTIGGSA